MYETIESYEIIFVCNIINNSKYIIYFESKNISFKLLQIVSKVYKICFYLKYNIN